jgi:dihydrofolate synthase / folylpolyglutamate synthase
MTYRETLEYLYDQLPMFHRIGSAAYKADLKNTLELCKLLNHPEKKFQSVHIAGTNGKGSSSHMLAAILQTAGYKTGLFTSPHLKDFRERIRINGRMIEEEAVVSFVEKYKNQFDSIQLSFFEWAVALAFNYFAEKKIDIAVIETGLGGRLDSTNVITPLISVITNIGWDHTNLLGDTLEKIATEKAGIIKKQVPVIIGERQPSIESVFINRAFESESKISFANDFWNVEEISSDENFLTLNIYRNAILRFENLKLDLTGNYQKKNVIAVIETVEQLNFIGFNIPHTAISTALQNVRHLTGLMGRWQKLNDDPLTYCDVGHNKDGIKQVIEQINQIPHNHLHFVLGVVNDKDVSGILSMLPKDATYYFCKADIPRAMNAEDLKEQATSFNLFGNSFSSVWEALQAARVSAIKDDLIFVGGSTFVVAEVI